eukprot:1325159-Karenia_brevis.AAC.1
MRRCLCAPISGPWSLPQAPRPPARMGLCHCCLSETGMHVNVAVMLCRLCEGPHCHDCVATIVGQ